jgi:hypothetical protein
MPAVDQNMNVTGFVSRPDDLDVSEIPKSTQCIVEDIKPALLIRTGYRPSDLLLEKFKLIAIGVILECQHHESAIDDPFQGRRSDVLAATLFAKPQGVGEILESSLKLRRPDLAVDGILNLRLALTLCPEVVRQTNVRTIFDVQNFAVKPIEELVVRLFNGLDHPVQRGRLQKRHVLAHESNQGRFVGVQIRRYNQAGRRVAGTGFWFRINQLNVGGIAI